MRRLWQRASRHGHARGLLTSGVATVTCRTVRSLALGGGGAGSDAAAWLERCLANSVPLHVDRSLCGDLKDEAFLGHLSGLLCTHLYFLEEKFGVPLRWHPVARSAPEELRDAPLLAPLRNGLFRVYWHMMHDFEEVCHLYCDRCTPSSWSIDGSFEEMRNSCAEAEVLLFFAETALPAKGPVEDAGLSYRDYLACLTPRERVVVRFLLLVSTVGVLALVLRSKALRCWSERTIDAVLSGM